MAEFGRRTRQGEPRREAAAPVRRQVPVEVAQPLPTDLIPRRDLKQLENGRVPPWVNLSKGRFMGLAAFAVACMLGVLAMYGPDVARDLRYSGTFAVATDLRATDGSCTRHWFLITFCNAKINSLHESGFDRTTSFMMFFRSGSGAELVPVRSTANPSVVGVRYAVSEVLMTRVLSLLGGTMFLAWLSWVLFNNVRKGRYKDGPAHEALMRYLAAQPQPA